MEHLFYTGRLADQHSLSVTAPNKEGRASVPPIYEQLVAGKVLPASRDAHRAIITRTVENGAEALILGCTAIMHLVRPEDSEVPIFDTDAMHAVPAIEVVLAG